MIQLYHVYKYYNQIPALYDCNLRIFKGDIAFITGPSGAGKSTLLKLIYLAELSTKGKIIIAGRNIENLKSTHRSMLRRTIGVVFQGFKLVPYKTVFENVAVALEVIGLPRSLIEKRVSLFLKKLGLFHKRKEYPPALSGGEQQRVAIARALVNDPQILLADEPTGNLDEGLTAEIFDLFREVNNRGTTIVVATHDTKLLQYYCKYNIKLDKGMIVGC